MPYRQVSGGVAHNPLKALDLSGLDPIIADGYCRSAIAISVDYLP